MQVQDNRLSSMRAHFDRMLRKTDTAQEEYRPLFQRLVTDMLGRPSSDVLLADDARLSESEILRMLWAIKDFRAGRPIQYIIGHTDFYGLEISCDKRALIPRPETEELIRWIEEEHQDKRSILDIGTGSGCIALALASLGQHHQLSAIDCSLEALSLAKENAKKLNLEIDFIQDDILKTTKDYPQYDIIISNPPYVRDSEKEEMNVCVLAHEPKLALFVKDSDPLLFYTAIALFAQNHLKPNGNLYFEINEKFGKETQTMLIEKGFENVEIRQDLYGKDRMVRAVYTG